jgi:hydrogenase expression/formation protein HypD
MAVTQLEEGRHQVENQYARSVRRQGTEPARALVAQVFELADRPWRGIGTIPMSGLRLRADFAAYDAERKFGVGELRVAEAADCRAGDVLTGRIKPPQCAAFGARCTPEHPLGAPMVSSEGACSAYFNLARYRRGEGAGAIA